MESGDAVKLGRIDEAAKRRTVQLVNPGLIAEKATTRTIQMSIQLVKPGERAECHRHSAAALRFVVEGDGTAYTNVESEQMFMEPGDLILTPNWTWHDHFNGGDGPIVWLDGLDIRLVGTFGDLRLTLQIALPSRKRLSVRNFLVVDQENLFRRSSGIRTLRVDYSSF